jgi:hypothetical protein
MVVSADKVVSEVTWLHMELPIYILPLKTLSKENKRAKKKYEFGQRDFLNRTIVGRLEFNPEGGGLARKEP